MPKLSNIDFTLLILLISVLFAAGIVAVYAIRTKEFQEICQAGSVIVFDKPYKCEAL